MVDLIAFVAIAVIVGVAAGYVYREKKRGTKCIGCPEGNSCSGRCSGSCGCGNCHN